MFEFTELHLALSPLFLIIVLTVWKYCGYPHVRENIKKLHSLFGKRLLNQ